MRVLLIVHGFPPAASGGTEVYTRALALALAAQPGVEVGVLARESDPDRPELALRTGAIGAVRLYTINNTFRGCATFADSFEHPTLLTVAAGVLDTFRPDLVHIQHLTCLSTALPRAIARRQIPTVLTLNDYWLLCHRGQLLDLDGRRCDGPFDGGCARCIPASALPGRASRAAGRFARQLPLPGAAGAVALAARAIDRLRPADTTRGATQARLDHMRDAVRDIDQVLAPSGTIADWFTRFGIPPDRMTRCDQGIDLAGFDGLHRLPSAALRIGFAGGLIPSKAPHLLLDALDLLPPGSVTLDLLGSAAAYHGRTDYADALAPRLTHPAIRKLGPVPHEQMPAALHDVDIVAVPSIWIENAPFIIREAFAAGAPVIASDLGGMAEMVREGVDGLLFPAGDAVALAARLRRLLEEPALLTHLRRGITRPMSIDADAAQLLELYDRLIRQRPRASRPSSAARPAPTLAAVVLNYRTPDQTWLAVRSLQTSFTPPDRIIVVDNASNDGSAARLRESLTGILVIEAPTNLGFSAGCNLGIREALALGTDRVLLVNSDAVLAPDALERLLARMDADPSIGVAAPLLLSREDPGMVASAGICYSRRTGRMRQRGAGQHVSALASEAPAIAALSGCVLLIRRDALTRVGLLDEAFFFSFEDIEFCLRAAASGFQSVCVEEAVAYHEGGRTIGRRSARRVYFATRNHLRLHNRAAPRGWRTLGSAAIVALNAAYVVRASDAPLVRGLAAVARGTWHHVRRRYGPD